MDDPNPASKRPLGIYLLPNLLTTAGLFAGFYAVVAAIGGRFEAAAVALFIAMVMDALDGRVARLTNTQTQFGAEYDSLADMVSFGLAPAVTAFQWSLYSFGKLGWLAAFVYVAAAALRLARFNTQIGSADRRYFQGLPSPAAAAVVAGLVWTGADYGLSGEAWRFAALILTAAAGLCMVSNLRYHSFKELPLRRRVPFVLLFLVAVLFVLISLDPPRVLFLFALLYLLSGPFATILYVRRRRDERRRARALTASRAADEADEAARQ